MARVSWHLNVGTLGTVVLESDDVIDLIQAAKFWQELPKKCPKCGSGLTLVHSHVTSKRQENYGEEFDYYRLRCLGMPRHETTLGQHKEKKGGGLYYKWNSEWSTYAPNDEDGENESPPTPRKAEAEQAPRKEPAAQGSPLVTANQASEFFATMLKEYRIRPQEVMPVAKAVLGRTPKALTELTLEQLREVKRQLLQKGGSSSDSPSARGLGDQRIDPAEGAPDLFKEPA